MPALGAWELVSNTCVLLATICRDDGEKYYKPRLAINLVLICFTNSNLVRNQDLV